MTKDFGACQPNCYLDFKRPRAQGSNLRNIRDQRVCELRFWLVVV